MKKGIILVSCFMVLAHAAPDFTKYEDKFNTLSQKRVGLSDAQISSLVNPFSKKNSEAEATIQEVSPDELIGKELTAIIGDRVRINNEWHAVGDYMGSYRIMSIRNDSVLLENENNNIELKLRKGNKNVIITH